MKSNFLLLILLISCTSKSQLKDNKTSVQDSIAVQSDKNSNEGNNLLNSVINITGREFNNGTSLSGMVKGEAVIAIQPMGQKIKVIVKYRYIMSSGIKEAQEEGYLENYKITEDGPNNTKIIHADWDNQNAGDGSFILRSYQEDEPKIIIAQINSKAGGNWYHNAWVELSDEDYKKFQKVMGINKDQLNDSSSRAQLTEDKAQPSQNETSQTNNKDSEKLFLKIINQYYNDCNMGEFFAKNYFSQSVIQFITAKNLTPSKIDDIFLNNKEFINSKSYVINNEISYDRTENGVDYYIYWINYSCHRKSLNKKQNCKIQVEIGFDKQNKIKSYRETKVTNLHFTDN